MMYSQFRYGGINPPMAQEFHRQHIECVVNEALSVANLNVADDVDAIAVTNRPGILLSLIIGVRYAKHLARKYKKPLIPVHHMKAHALMARLEYMTDFSISMFVGQWRALSINIRTEYDGFLFIG